jgi:hypothetical protein
VRASAGQWSVIYSSLVLILSVPPTLAAPAPSICTLHPHTHRSARMQQRRNKSGSKRKKRCARQRRNGRRRRRRRRWRGRTAGRIKRTESSVGSRARTNEGRRNKTTLSLQEADGKKQARKLETKQQLLWEAVRWKAVMRTRIQFAILMPVRLIAILIPAVMPVYARSVMQAWAQYCALLQQRRTDQALQLYKGAQ